MAEQQSATGAQAQPAGIRFDLITNARDSLAHAVSHLAGPDGSSPGNLKIAVREVAQVVELLLKERLRREHPAFVLKNVDEHPSATANTVTTMLAVKRLAAMCQVHLAPEAVKSIEAGRRLRNSIEHYEFHLEEKEARGIIGRLLSFIFDFSKQHLKLDLESEFRQDHRWKALVEIFEFWAAHKTVVAESLRAAKRDAVDCPSCGATTFDWDGEKCALCDHEEAPVMCDGCENCFLSPDVKTVADDYRERTLCRDCQWSDYHGNYDSNY